MFSGSVVALILGSVCQIDFPPNLLFFGLFFSLLRMEASKKPLSLQMPCSTTFDLLAFAAAHSMGLKHLTLTVSTAKAALRISGSRICNGPRL